MLDRKNKREDDSIKGLHLNLYLLGWLDWDSLRGTRGSTCLRKDRTLFSRTITMPYYYHITLLYMILLSYIGSLVLMDIHSMDTPLDWVKNEEEDAFVCKRGVQ